MTTSTPSLNVGVVGLSLAAANVTPAIVTMPHVNLVAGADINPRALQAFKVKYGAKTYISVEALCDDPEVNTVWIATPRGTRFLSDLGLLVVSCEHGEMRQSPAGIYIYSDAGTTEVPLTESGTAYAPELDELYDALVHGKPVLHDGRWGLATLEVCLAIMQSATAHQDIPMQHQVAVPHGA